MCYDWYDESLYAERIRVAREEALRRQREAKKPAEPQAPGAKPENEPRTQPDAVPV